MTMLEKLAYAGRRVRDAFKMSARLIIDRERSLGDFGLPPATYATDLLKEEVSRRHVLGREGQNMNFLDVGARDGSLTYLLGIRGSLDFDDGFYQSNLRAFQAKYNYYGMDLLPADDERVLSGDACDPGYLHKHPSLLNSFDVVYSNNVFEHFERPWIAAGNLTRLVKVGGLVITVVPFAQRYHESPGDFFRYTHKGVEALFASGGKFEVLDSGYDISSRRINWQGGGHGNDVVPVDRFGAWRETWFTVCVLRKISDSPQPSGDTAGCTSMNPGMNNA